MSRRFNRIVGKRIADRYAITGEIGRGGMGVVYRALPFEDPSHEVAIKLIQRNRRLGSDDLLRFQKEAAVMSQLHHQNIISFHELGILDGDFDSGMGSGYYIVMEYVDGFNLKDSLLRDGRKDLAFFFQIGLQVSSALDYTHGKNIIHRDIKPQNIIITKATGDDRGVLVKVLDFGVARLVEAMHSLSPGQLPDGSERRTGDDFAGTPLYMAPEQAAQGIGNPDHRADLYSLGCMLYEVLAGHPPFNGNSRDKLEKLHLSASPEPLSNVRPDVPPVVEQIVHKLLAKRPGERYQTAFSLHADLMQAKAIFETTPKRGFQLGLKDRFQAVSAQLVLQGRAQDFDVLLEEYQNTAKASRSHLTVIKGDAGMGKTRLLNEFKMHLAKNRIRFISGAFSQHETNLPFNALANAFNDYLIRALKSHSQEAEDLKKKIKTIVGPAAHQVALVVPGLKPFLEGISDGEATLDIDGDNFKTFAKAFADFTRCLATDQHPVVFIFDDLHWADDRTLELIDQFFGNANTLRFHLVISYRQGLHKYSTKFRQFIEKFSRLRRRYTEIELQGISPEAAADMIKNMLKSAVEPSRDFAEHVFKASGGVPLMIVEWVRSAVAEDLIFLETQNDEWHFNLQAIQNAKPRMSTIDIVLSRLHTYANTEREILEAAATAGMSFQYEMVVNASNQPASTVMQTLQQCLEDGIILRLGDEQRLVNLGKSYMFAHKKIRDGVYERITVTHRKQLHLRIAKSLLSALGQPEGRYLFAVAHHLNQAVSQEDVEQTVAQSCLSINLKAGEEATKSASWQSAEKYYEFALQIIDRFKNLNVDPELRSTIMEKLADLNANQRHFGEALYKYKQILSSSAKPLTKMYITTKTLYFQMVQGLIGESFKLLNVALQLWGAQLPKFSYARWWQARLSLMWDSLPWHGKNGRIFRTLLAGFADRGQSLQDLERNKSSAKLYSLAQMLFARDDQRVALIAHEKAFQLAKAGRADPLTTIRVVADRAFLIAHLGYTRSAYRYFDWAADLGRSLNLPAGYAYAQLQRALSIDYIKTRQDEISDNLKEALDYLTPEDDRLAYANTLVFRMWRELLRCNVAHVSHLAGQFPDTLPTRNWLSPRGASILLFGFMIRGARDALLDQGEKFLKRRQQVAGRQDDVFSQVIQTMIGYARGEIDRCRTSFARTVHLLTQRHHGEWLAAFEEDFLTLFCLVFPLMFEHEYGRKLMRHLEMHQLAGKLFEKVRASGKIPRAVPILADARLREFLGQGRFKHLFDEALRSGKESGANLIQVLSYIWFGIYLYDAGFLQKKDYLRRAYAMCRRFGLDGLAGYVRKCLERRRIEWDEPETSQINQRQHSRRIGVIPNKLVLDHLSHLADGYNNENSLEADVALSVDILRQEFPSGNILIYLGHQAEVENRLYPVEGTKDVPHIFPHIALYFNLRSSLTMHISVAPWLYQEGKHLPTDPSGNTASSGMTQEQLGPMDSTMVITPPPVSLSNLSNSSLANSYAPERVKEGDSSQHFALVPLRNQNETLGLLVLEDIGSWSNRDLNSCRREFDIIGAQLGMLIKKKEATPNEQVPLYQAGGCYLEPCSWLNPWLSGRMRTERESSWYLGLNFGANHYVLVYCCIKGQRELRESFSRLLWQQIFVQRILAAASGRNDLELYELRDDLGGFFSHATVAGQMDDVMFAFSIFDKQTATVASGHFGSSRPFVLGSENKVMAFNEETVQLKDGRSLRYWEVTANLDQPHAYVLSYDTSKVESAEQAWGKSSSQFSATHLLHQSHYQKMLDKLSERSDLPRYYVAVVLRRENNALSGVKNAS